MFCASDILCVNDIHCDSWNSTWQKYSPVGTIQIYCIDGWCWQEEDIQIPTFVEEDVNNYVEQVGKQVISVHEQVCKSSDSLYVLQGFYKIM